MKGPNATTIDIVELVRSAFNVVKVEGTNWTEWIKGQSEAIRVSPGDAEVYAARAFCYALLGRNGEAQQDVERAAELGFARTFLERAIEEVRRQPQLSRRQ